VMRLPGSDPLFAGRFAFLRRTIVSSWWRGFASVGSHDLMRGVFVMVVPVKSPKTDQVSDLAGALAGAGAGVDAGAGVLPDAVLESPEAGVEAPPESPDDLSAV